MTRSRRGAGKIWLIGMMGSGKSIVGRKLAKRMNVPFVDLDREIETRAGRSIVRIFREEGEPAFRRMEARAVRDAGGSARSCVIATGGGATLLRANVDLMRRSGAVVWLEADPETLQKRVAAQPGIRPVLGRGDAHATLARLLAQRKSRYARAAHHRVWTGGRRPAEVAAEVAARAGASTIRVRGARKTSGHEVRVESGSLATAGTRIREALGRPGSAAVVVTDRNVAGLYGGRLDRSLRKAGYRPVRVEIPPGERHKNLTTVKRIWDGILAAGADRNTPVIALGGGVVGDLAGFAAATALRGLPLIQIPTSIVAQVDSAIGGKTGFDTSRGKNLIGAFKEPLLVIADPDLLRGLPPRQWRAGLGEVVKYAAIADATLFSRLERAPVLDVLPESAELTALVRRCAEIKARVVSTDPLETGLRGILNFGHTVGHAVEAAERYRGLLHGEAVSAGMVAEAEFAAVRGACPAKDVRRLAGLLHGFGLPILIRRKGLGKYLSLDKKRDGGFIKMPIFRRVGRVDLERIPLRELVRFLEN